MSDIPELTAIDFRGAISARLRKRLAQGVFERGEDIQALRRFVGLSQANFASALGISVHSLGLKARFLAALGMTRGPARPWRRCAG